MKKVATVASLKEVLAYDNQDVIYRFMKYYDLPLMEVQELFQETKKWLWLSALSLEQGHIVRMSIWKEMFMIDEMWHNFILFTKDYHNFCWQYFGQFIHHLPQSQQETEQYLKSFETDRQSAFAKVQKDMEEQYSFIYDHLGSETLIKWMELFPQKYTPAFLESIRKSAV